MTCKNDWGCEFPEHIRKMIELLSGEEKKEWAEFYKKLMEVCNSNAVDRMFCCYGKIINITCSSSEISCCPKFPDCTTVKSRQTIFSDDLLRLSLETCTSLGIGRCSKMMELDASIIFDSNRKSDITLARSVHKKFKGL